MLTPKLTIEEVEQAFAVWRSTKKRTSPIPDALCSQIKVLLKSYPPSKVFSRLGLSKQQARNKGLLPQSSSPSAITKNHFIPLPTPQQISLNNISQPGSVTIARGGTQLCLSNISDEQLRLVVGVFLESI